MYAGEKKVIFSRETEVRKMKKVFFRKNAEPARKAVAGERKAREARLKDAVDRRFGAGPTDERILACASAQLRMEIAELFWN